MLVALLSVLAVVVTHFFGTNVWRLLMSDQGHRVPLGIALQVFYISQLGKYLPGNVGQFLGRGVLAKSTGIPVGVYTGGGLSAPVFLDADFLLGPEAAHLNITGVSGLATKTSAVEFLEQQAAYREAAPVGESRAIGRTGAV